MKYILIIAAIWGFQNTYPNSECTETLDKNIEPIVFNTLNNYRLQGNENKVNEIIANLAEGYYKSYLIGYSYLMGNGRLKNLELAEKYLLKTVSYCYSPAYYALGYLYTEKNNSVLAKKFYELDKNMGNMYSVYALAKIYKSEGNIKLYIDNLLLADSYGFSPATLELAELYFNGELVEKNVKKSFYYYKILALKNNIIAQDRIIYFYENNIIPFDEDDYLFWKKYRVGNYYG